MISMEKEETRSNKKIIFIASGILLVLIIGIIIWGIYSRIESKPKLNPIDAQCRFACENAQRTGFCFVERKVNDELTATCDELSKNPLYAEYNVEACPAISCVAQENQKEKDQTCVTGLGGKWEFPDAQGKCPQSGEEVIRQVTPSNEPPVQGQICCR